MDKTLLRNFAKESRVELIEKIKNKIESLYLEEDLKLEKVGDLYVLSKGESIILQLSKEDYDNRDVLKRRVKELSIKQVIEEASYTWFNRIIAIRYMEIHDFLPLTVDNESLGIKIFSDKNDELDPEILKYSNIINPDLDLNINIEKYNSLINDNEKFKYILLKVCEKLGKVIPQVFDGVTDYINLLIPDNMLKEDRIIGKLVKNIPIDNFNDVEVIGWLYQYYNQEEKDRVIGAKKAYMKNEIPYATQLFTPDWIVKYMVENSLGKYWLENHENEELQKSFKYYIEDAKQDEEVQKELNKLKNPNLKPQEITFIDPCCGSGHILVYAFEVLYKIYESFGYNKQDIPKLILENNIYGLDIDDRAGQLAVLAVLLKAREYDKRLFNKKINLNIMSIQESNMIKKEALDLIKSNKEDIESYTLNETIDYIYDSFKDAKEYGSILKIEKKDYQLILKIIEEENHKQLDMFELENLEEINSKFLLLVKQAIILSNKYDIVTTNPPYLNGSVMSIKLKEYVNKNFKNVKTDLFSVFIERNSVYGKLGAYMGYMTPNVWMFISSYEKLRKYIINEKSIISLIQMSKGAFFKEATVDICAFILRNNNYNYNGNYIRLESFKGGMEVQEQKVLEAVKDINVDYLYNKKNKKFNKLPGSPIVYWADEKYISIFEKGIILKKSGDTRQGMATSDNNRFLRLWHEVNEEKIGYDFKSAEDACKSNKKWFPYNKGGCFRKWYGNIEYLINYENNGEDIKKYAMSLYKSVTRTIKSISEYFKDNISWSKISSGSISFRYYTNGFIFDVAGCCIFYLDKKNMKYHLAILNSKIVKEILNMISPTLNYEAGHIASLPIIEEKEKLNEIIIIVDNSIAISKKDWDSFETSWNFKSHPLLEFKSSMPGLVDANNIHKSEPAHIKISKNIYGEDICIADNIPLNSKIESSFDKWEKYCEKQFNQLKENEEELNRIFINVYDLQGELTPEVEDKDVTIRKADRERDIKSFISYAVGCMFGRYSIYKEGLVYAGGEFNMDKYIEFGLKYLDNIFIQGEKKDMVENIFTPDIDNIVPITDEAYFGDDIVSRFKEFLVKAFGSNTLNENLDYIAETLGKRGTETSEETIRRYFNNDFYNDHIKIYKKKPIYWLFDSGKKNGFKCLIYMHRYNENLVPKVRLDYLHRIQTTYEKLLSDINYKLTTDLSMNDKKEVQKRQADLNAKLLEIKEYDEKIAHIANQRINIDLDNGVTANYAKFEYILGKVK